MTGSAASCGTAKAVQSEVRLADLVAALSLGIDLGFGQPMEHVLRQCLFALRLADRTMRRSTRRVTLTTCRRAMCRRSQPGSEFIQFSPTDELAVTLKAMQANIEAMQRGR